jgi:tripartite-type tricarboxylate transporter receptor subunit TctC
VKVWLHSTGDASPLAALLLAQIFLIFSGAIAGAVLLTSSAQTAVAQDFPTKPITLVTGAVPGSVTDQVTRVVGSQISERLKQPVVVANMVGAFGMLAVQRVRSAPADGYTMLVAGAEVFLAEPLLRENRLTVVKPVAQIAAIPLVIEAHPGAAISKLSDLVALPLSQGYRLRRPATCHHCSSRACKELLRPVSSA